MKRLDVYVVGPYTVALILSGGLYYYARQISAAPEGQLGADIWPKTILVLAMITCVWKIGHSLFSASSNRAGHPAQVDADATLIPHGDGSAHDVANVTRLTPWIGIALTAIYVFAFPWLGYPIATFLYVTAFVYFGNFRRPLVAACVALVSSIGFMFLFMRIVYVSLPIGVEPFAQVSTVLMRAMGVK